MPIKLPEGYKPEFVQETTAPDGRLLAHGKLKYGMKIGEAVHVDFVMKEPNTADLFAAEGVAVTDRPLAFNGALMARQLQKIGSFEGPFTLDLIGRLKPCDYNTLRLAQQELDLLGEVQ